MRFSLNNYIVLLGFIVGIASIITLGYAEERLKVRSSPLAGGWYPSNSEDLRKMLTNYLKEAQVPKIDANIFALISPHAGYSFSGRAAAYGFKTIVGKEYDRVIILGPSHYERFRGICVSSYDSYETPLGRVPVERKVGDDLSRSSLFKPNPNAEAQEHSLEMEIPYLQMVLKNFKIIPLVVGELREDDYPIIAELLRPLLTEKTLVVVSSDFTHFGWRFGYLPFSENIKENLRKLDLGAVDSILKKDLTGYLHYLQETGITICGGAPIGILLQLLPPEVEGSLLTYYTSGDLLNDYSSTVSYVSLVFKRPVVK
ncbi:MAG: AmmeMemoRadiSam system protein B [Pseudomonadota bacterium]